MEKGPLEPRSERNESKGMLKSALNRLLKFIFVGSGDDPLSLLKDDYVREKALAAQLKAHAESMPYEHFRRQLLELAAMDEEAAQALAKKIKAAGSPLPDVPEPEPVQETVLSPASAGKETLWEKLARDVDELNRLYYRYIPHAADHQDDDLIELLSRLHREKNAQSLAIQRMASGLHGYSL